jgi:hypothetical protein
MRPGNYVEGGEMWRGIGESRKRRICIEVQDLYVVQRDGELLNFSCNSYLLYRNSPYSISRGL